MKHLPFNSSIGVASIVLAKTVQGVGSMGD